MLFINEISVRDGPGGCGKRLSNIGCGFESVCMDCVICCSIKLLSTI